MPGISKALASAGAELAFSYQGEALGKRVKPLAAELGPDFVLPCDVKDVGGSALYLLSDLSHGVTGEIHYVDAGT